MGRMLRRAVTAAACVVVLSVVTALTAIADIDQPSQNPTTGHKGAPNQTCQTFTVTPGNAANAPGSPFNPNGNAGLHYAGNPNTSSLAHSNSTASVAQYDNACVRLSSH